MTHATTNRTSRNWNSRPGGGIDRRKFLGALGVAAAAGAFLGRGGPASGQSPSPTTNWFYDSFGNVVPEADDAVAAGIVPPPLPVRVTPGGAPPPTSPVTYVTNNYAQPNILLIMVDQMRLPRWLTPSQRTTLFSNIMPNLYGSSGFASSATTFPNYFVAAVACTPSRSTLLTGLYPQQTCMFATQDVSSAPSLQPYGSGGFPTIGDVLSQSLNNQAGGMLPTYNTAWIGKWHVSDLELSGTGPGSNGPSDYGFTNPFSLPTNVYSMIYPKPYPSPNGLENEATHGYNLKGGLQTFIYNTAAGDPGDVNAGTLNIHNHAGYQISDAAIYHAFHSYWLNTPPPTPWFLSVSFIGPHDMQSFPWALGLATDLNGQACGPSNDFGCCYNGDTGGFYPPPVLGWMDNYNSASVINFNGLNSFCTAPPPNWNNTESPNSLPYTSTGGKPDLQAYFQNQINLTSGDINTLTGWNTFLNYYYWLHGSFDTLVGLVLGDIKSQFNTTASTPVIIFTSDHGDLGGSHSLHAKEGTLYDEAFNVPLIIQMQNQHSAVQRTSFMCSSVDILPFIYSLALGNESWRTNPDDIVSYLNNRESIFDIIMANEGDSRRLAPFTNAGGFGHSGHELAYVLFSTDEYPRAFNSAGEQVPSHAIAFRTLDNTVRVFDANTGMNFFGGGKLGMYTSWVPCTTFPNAAAPYPLAPQFEFYDYYPGGNNNYGEIGNDAFNSGGAWNGATAGVYLNSYNNIMAQELYYIDPKFQGAFNTAFTAYMTFIGTGNGGGTTCPIEVGPPDTIPWP
jgi:arylsulfatase A-like enzyme